MQEFCSQNPYHEVCGYGGGGVSGMVTCPYTGIPVSRPEDCPEFSGTGGGGGCADSSSSDCGSDDDGEDAEPTISGADSDTRRIMNCIARRQEWKDHLASISDANITFEYRALEAREGHAHGRRLGNTSGENGTYRITIDTAAIEGSAHSANWSYRQLLAEAVLHEMMHVLYDMDPNKNVPNPHEPGDALYQDAWTLYKAVFGVRAPMNNYHPATDGGLPRCLRD